MWRFRAKLSLFGVLLARKILKVALATKGKKVALLEHLDFRQRRFSDSKIWLHWTQDYYNRYMLPLVMGYVQIFRVRIESLGFTLKKGLRVQTSGPSRIQTFFACYGIFINKE